MGCFRETEVCLLEREFEDGSGAFCVVVFSVLSMVARCVNVGYCSRGSDTWGVHGSLGYRYKIQDI